mmetsp:Transcript_7481/g.12006  ORF Transcript_7481/g.12006 Transcript_7481/m.12006 type:complete len:338 (-) Transcript_7481:3378-4391(-)|eukprot:CAMPEP_0203757842 /NCGR_PEP_ID=MMETSP0098-20131031/10721_1 /ASSEMBLY_ACC=CAM_ASM_000208 /TAXON_ID=96639 /ORGANISM=" , Strain NY0313808BC1" /LENGTH=337 /DNA_ID=CAMNT_0050650085 /DNA_START=223 /DNA_END=1236 /DNA_ORIENTATION=-
MLLARNFAAVFCIVGAACTPEVLGGGIFNGFSGVGTLDVDGQDVATFAMSGAGLRGFDQDGKLPVVLAHGMGDSCFNPGMAQITKLVGEHSGTYSTCIGDGDSQATDTVNGFLSNMIKEVEFFAKKVRKNPKLKNGFNGVGLSQGNLVIRGYIEMYNDPPVKRFISIHGPMQGAASLPQCDPEGFAKALCDKVTNLVGDVAYTSFIQHLVAQANYLKDPTEMDQYLKHNIFLPKLNNEVEHEDSQKYKENFASLEKLALVQAEDDTMIFPKESEWFGHFADGGFETVLAYNETDAYKTDAFGLKTLINSGRVLFKTSKGNHLRFTLDDLYGWLDEVF